jgi:hypothetical protein
LAAAAAESNDPIEAIANADVADAPVLPAVEEEPVVAAPRAAAPRFIPERPADQPVIIANAGAQTATRPQPVAPQPARAPQAAPIVQQSTGGYVMQISSQPSIELAQASATNLSQRYSNIIGGRQIKIQRAEIEGRGTFHRVRVVASSRDDAIALCERYKSAGGSCFVAR